MTRVTQKKTLGLYSKCMHHQRQVGGSLPVFRGTLGSRRRRQAGAGILSSAFGLGKRFLPKLAKTVFGKKGKALMKKVAPKILDITLKKTQQVIEKKKTAKQAVKEAVNESIALGRGKNRKRAKPITKGHQRGGSRVKKSRFVVVKRGRKDIFDAL